MTNYCSPSLKVTFDNIFLEATSFMYYGQSLFNFEEPSLLAEGSITANMCLQSIEIHFKIIL